MTRAQLATTISDLRATALLTGLVLLLTALALGGSSATTAGPAPRAAVGTCADASIPARLNCAGPYDNRYSCEMTRTTSHHAWSLPCRRDSVHGDGKWFYGYN